MTPAHQTPLTVIAFLTKDYNMHMYVLGIFEFVNSFDYGLSEHCIRIKSSIAPNSVPHCERNRTRNNYRWSEYPCMILSSWILAAFYLHFSIWNVSLVDLIWSCGINTLIYREQPNPAIISPVSSRLISKFFLDISTRIFNGGSYLSKG